MKVTVISATGGIGRSVVEQAVAAGHDVTATARDPRRVQAPVRAVRVDLDETSPAAAAALQSAVVGADAVVSGLGPRSRADAGITARGTRAVIRAMQDGGPRRLVVVSAAPVATVASPGRPNPPRYDPGDGFWTRHLLFPLTSLFLRRHYADLALMEDDLRGSGLEWISVRPPQLTDGPFTGVYRTAQDRNVPGGLRISRADVAHLMLTLAERDDAGGYSVGCGY